MDFQKALQHVLNEGGLTSNERIILAQVISNSNALYRCPVSTKELHTLTQLSGASFYNARNSLMDKHLLVQHKDPHYYIAWPFTGLYNSEGGGGRLWTTPQKIRILLSLTDEKITALTSLSQDYDDRKKAAQQGHGLWTKEQERVQALHNLDALYDIREDLDQYLRRNEQQPIPLSQEKPPKRKRQKA